MRCAPVSIPVYGRVDHFKRCINSLLSNSLSVNTVLYIYSDAASPGDEQRVDEVRRYIKNITGFKEVVVIEQQVNKRLGNIIESMEGPLNNHSSLIYLEEDLVVADTFLQFMNESLEYYENDRRIFSVTGFTQPPCIDPACSTVSASSIFSAWSCGLWRDKYLSFKSFYGEASLHDRLALISYSTLRMIMDHTFQMYFYSYHLSKLGKLTPDWAIGYYIWVNKLLQVYPPVSLVSQAGLDGSGWHSAVDDRFDQFLGKGISVKLIQEFDDCLSKKNFDKIKRFHGLGPLNDVKFILKSIIKLALRKRLL
jgi:hypothetical protein